MQALSWAILSVFLGLLSSWNIHLLPRFSFLADEIKLSSNTFLYSHFICWCLMPQYSLQRSSSVSWYYHHRASLWVWCSYAQPYLLRKWRAELLLKSSSFVSSDRIIVDSAAFRSSCDSFWVTAGFSLISYLPYQSESVLWNHVWGRLVVVPGTLHLWINCTGCVTSLRMFKAL